MTRIIPAATLRARRTIRSGFAGLLATTSLIATVACSGSGDSSTGPRDNQNPVGTFALFQVDQKNIPKVIFRGPYTFPGGATYDDFVFTITGGELILEDNGDIHSAIDYRAAADGDEISGTRAAEGTFEVDGNQISISSGNGGVDGTYRNGVITLQLDLLGDGELQTYTFRYVP
jgi:hypothetical protein